MSGQRILDEYGDPNALFNDAQDFLGGLVGRVQNRLRDVGIDLDWLSQSPREIDEPGDIWVYQFVVAYSKGALKGEKNRGERALEGSASPELQFKTGIYVIGEPTSDLENRFRTIDNPRLRNLFNTGPYAGYIDGFGFSESATYVQRESVSVREVEQKGVGLGVPWFEVEAYDEDGELSGLADGHFNPYSTVTIPGEPARGEAPPEQEVWSVRSALNKARGAGGQWDVGPSGRTGASERTRTEDIRGKSVYIGPFEIGTVTKRGTAWLRRQYENGGQYADKATITSQSGIPPQALQKGANLYKYRETEDAIYLSTSEPADFSPTDPAEVRPTQTGIEGGAEDVTEVLLDDDEPTQFTVKTDKRENLPPDGHTGRLLGLYDPVVVRDITRGYSGP